VPVSALEGDTEIRKSVDEGVPWEGDSFVSEYSWVLAHLRDCDARLPDYYLRSQSRASSMR
jgi:hypothetical protein